MEKIKDEENEDDNDKRIDENVNLTRYWNLKKVYFSNACPIAINFAFEQTKNSAMDYAVCTYHNKKGTTIE